jgi:hypothetical protein
MKFALGRTVFARPLSFPSAEAAHGNLLAEKIFALNGVYNVFMVQDFVTVNKLPEVAWEPLVAAIQIILDAHMARHSAMQS